VSARGPDGTRVLARASVLAIAACASLGLVGAYVAAGGGGYEPRAVADPCRPREWREPAGIEGLLDQVALSAADGAACELGVTREELVIALGSPRGRRAFVRERGLSAGDLEHAARAGLERALADARRADAIGPLEEFLLRQAIRGLPIDFIIGRIEGLEGR
jgi:hypothetical protein